MFLPARGESTAPIFDPDHPRTLRRFFDDLEHLFDAANITDHQQRKRHTTRYVDFDTAELWETISTFSNPSATFSQFQNDVQAFYPECEDYFRYTMQDLDALVTKQHQTTIDTLFDLGEYHRQFLVISSYLMSQEIIQEFEQRRTYARGFPSTLWTRISHRLQLRMPDHFPSTPYPIDDVFDAATWVLQHGSSLSPSASPAIASVSDASPLIVTPSTPASQPDIRSLFSKFTKSIVDAIASSTSDPSTRMTDCDFCGGEHFIRDCDAATEYIQLGKCKRNIDGKITLPSGAFVPRYIPGTLLRDRIDEWHRRNPGPVQSNLFHSISTASSAQASISATITTTAATSTSTDRASQPAKEDRIATLQAEIRALRSKIPQTVQPGAFPFHRSIDIATLPTSTSSSDIDYNIASLFDPADTSDDTSARHLKGYEPPTTPTFGSKAPVSKKKAAPQQTKASTDTSDTAIGTFQRSLDCPITISTSQLLLTAPDIRKQYFDATRPATRPIADPSAATALRNSDIDIETRPSDTAHIAIAPLVDMFYANVVLSPSQHLQSPSSPVTVSSSIDIDFTSFDAETDIATTPESGFAFSSPIQAPSSDFDKYQPLVSPEHRFDHRPSIAQIPQSPQRFQSSCRRSITRRHRFKSLLRLFSSSHRRIAPHRFSFRRQPSKPRRHRSTLRPRRFPPRLRSHRRIFALRRRLTPSPFRFTSQPVASFIEPPQNTLSTPLRPPVDPTLQDRPPRARLRHSIASTRRPSRRYHLRHHIPSSRRPIAALLSLLDPTASLRQVTDSFYHFDVTSFVSTYFSPSIPRFDVVDTPFDRTQTPSQPSTLTQAAPG